MTSPALSKRDRQVLIDFDGTVRDFSRQFIEQQRILDIRTENKILLVNDLQEFFKRRSELDLEYGKNLDRLCERFTERSQKQRANYGYSKKDSASFVNLWAKLLIDAKFKAKTATILSDIYSKNIVTRLSELGEDVQRTARSVKDTHLTLQQEVTNLITQLQTNMKDYFTRHAEAIFAEGKLRASESDMRKAEESPQKKGIEKKLKNLEKLLDKKQAKFVDCKLKATRRRNSYILSVGAALSVLTKYYDYDLTEIISRYDHNFHNSFSSTLQAFIGAEIRMASAQIQAANSLAHTVSIMDAYGDNKMFLEDNFKHFSPIHKFSFEPHAEDTVTTVTGYQNIETELKCEHRTLFEILRLLKVELSDLQSSMEKRKKGLESTYKKYDFEMNGFYHIDMSPLSNSATSPTGSLTANPDHQLKVDKEEWETGLLSKFKEFIMSQSLEVQTQEKYDILNKALGEIAANPTANDAAFNGKRRTVKLFGTSLKKQLDEAGQEIPEIVVSCVKYIAKYGLKHQGIFRVPGASQEISDLKITFEECRDPLSGLNHWKDINAVAGVFRVYFREMSEPLFPFELNSDYLHASSITRVSELIAEAKVILNKIAIWNLHVIKYMLKFLNLISQYSEQNKMTSHNLAVVFGPTLFRVPENENLLTNQGQINVFIDVLINAFYQIFPDEPSDGGFEDKPDCTSDDMEDGDRTDDDLYSEDDNEDSAEAVALYNYTARTQKEVSFNKGDLIQIFSQTNADWWDARVNGQFGFVPVPYIKVIERPVSISETEQGYKKIKSNVEPLMSPDDEKHKRVCESPPPSPRPPAELGSESTLRSSSTSDVGSLSPDDHAGNVFASIDPTITPQSPATVKRSGSDRSGASDFRVNIPIRSNTEKITPRMYQSKAANPGGDPQELTSEQLDTTVSAVSSAFSSYATKAAAKPLHLSQQDLAANKLRSNTEPLESRRSVKDKSKLFIAPILERPVSSFGRPAHGQIKIEPIDRTDSVPSFKPAPPPPALKPKPGLRKLNHEFAQTLYAAAAAKSNRDTDGEVKDITHL